MTTATSVPVQAAPYLGPPLAAQRRELAWWFRPVADTGELKRVACHIAQTNRRLTAFLGLLGLPDVPEEHRFWAAQVLPAVIAEIKRRERPAPIYRPGASPIDRLRAIDIVALAERFTALAPAGPGKLRGCCPLHKERTPSFYVYTGGQRPRWKCYGACAAGGDAIDLLRALVEKGVLS